MFTRIVKCAKMQFMSMPIDKKILLKQIEHLEGEIRKKINEINELEAVMKATKALLLTYEEPDRDFIHQSSNINNFNKRTQSSNNNLFSNNWTYESKYGASSVEALMSILKNGPLTINEITKRLLDLGHFQNNVNPKASVHVTLSRKTNLFEKIKGDNEILWKLKK